MSAFSKDELRSSVLVNEFSSTWFDLFLLPISKSDTNEEIEFILRHLPPALFPSLLDLCCGPGRHALPLADYGYQILGIDKDPRSIEQARKNAKPKTRFAICDMRELVSVKEIFDGIINLWQSFGYFEDRENENIFREIHAMLRPGGRFILDIYNRDALKYFPLRREFEKEGVKIVTEYKWFGDRVTCMLTYGKGEKRDSFNWRLYTPDGIYAISNSMGFHCLKACSRFREDLLPSPEYPRMQFVLERAE